MILSFLLITEWFGKCKYNSSARNGIKGERQRKDFSKHNIKTAILHPAAVSF